jgi:hypothetical protein
MQYILIIEAILFFIFVSYTVNIFKMSNSVMYEDENKMV